VHVQDCAGECENLSRLGRDAETGSATPARLKVFQQNVSMETLVRLSKPFGVQPWQLLHVGLGESQLSHEAHSFGARFDALPDSNKAAASALIDQVLELAHFRAAAEIERVAG